MLTSFSTLLELAQSATAFDADPVVYDNAMIGSRVRLRRISRGISQLELSRQLEIKRDDLSAYEAGAERISANLLLRISKLLDVRPDFFFRAALGEGAKAA